MDELETVLNIEVQFHSNKYSSFCKAGPELQTQDSSAKFYFFGTLTGSRGDFTAWLSLLRGETPGFE
jgi:hypothetical protein